MKGKGHSRPRFNPTPEEIRAGCLEIQSGWSDDQEEFRRTVRNPGATMDRPVVVHWNRGRLRGLNGT